MAITAGYDKAAGLAELRKSANSKHSVSSTLMTSSIGVDDKKHRGVCSEASGCMTESIGVDGEKHRGGWPKKKRITGINQSTFRSLTREQQFEYAKEYLNKKDKDFDDGTFAFSVTTFKNICNELGFVKVVTDTRATAADAQQSAHVIELSRSKREHTVEKKLRLSTDTVELMSSVITDKMTNEEKSKVLDIIIHEAFEQVAKERAEGKLRIKYKEKREVKEVRNVLL